MRFAGYCYRGPMDGTYVEFPEPFVRFAIYDAPAWPYVVTDDPPEAITIKTANYRFRHHRTPHTGGAWIWEPPPK